MSIVYLSFISIIQIVNGMLFLNITFSLILFKVAAAAGEFWTDIVPLNCMYASL